MKTLDEIVEMYNENYCLIEDVVPEFIPEIEYLISEFVLKYVFLDNAIENSDYLLAKALKLLLLILSGKISLKNLNYLLSP